MHVIERQGERLVAACDKEVMEVTFLSHGVEIKPTKKFYGSELVTEEELLLEIERCTSANVIGTKIIELLVKHSWIHKDAILWLEDPEDKTRKVGHAILIK